MRGKMWVRIVINPLNAELNPICHLLTLLEAHPILHVSRIKVNVDSLEMVFTGEIRSVVQGFRHCETDVLALLPYDTA
jgi:hypothetical protein